MSKRPKSRDAQYRSDVKKLKRLGLYNPKTDHATSYGKSQIRKYSDVLAGRATVVKAKAGKVHIASDIATRKKIHKELSASYRASAFRGILRVKNDRIIVAQEPSTKPRFDKRTGEITLDVKNVGEIKRGRLVPIKISNIDDLRNLESEGFSFSIPLKKFGARHIDWINYDDVNELIRDITAYYRKPSLARYVVLVPKGDFKARGAR